MRLIDADTALQRFIEETETSGNNAIHINTIKRLLQDIDTVYDVEKVVEELDSAKNYYYDDEFDEEGDLIMVKSVRQDVAIDIVRKGGAE